MINPEKSDPKTLISPIIILISLLSVVLSVTTTPTHASPISFDDIPEDAVSYTLTWPDGSEAVFTDKTQAEAAAGTEKLLETFTTDASGKATLSGYQSDSEIRLYESVIPDGYTAGVRNTVAKISDGKVTIINRKTSAVPASETHADKSSSSKTGSNPKTGDINSTPVWIGISIASAAAIACTVLIRKKKGRIFIAFLTAGALGAGALAAGSSTQADTNTTTFTVFKTDDDGAPVEGAVFEVYAKPVDIKWDEPAGQSADIVIIYTNDVHCGIDNNVGYAGLAAYKKEMEEAGNAVILVDDGDHIQGASIGLLTKGEAIIDIMNAVGYDLAIPGNHEYDYGMDQFFSLTDKADFPYISCNFTDLRKNTLVFEPYKIIEAAGRKVAFVGVTTPTTITESTPSYFQDENGNYIYSFLDGEDGQKLYNAVQSAVDGAKSEGADYCILISHSGVNAEDSPYTSSDIINNTTGIDAVLDGHSHTVLEMEKVKNKNGSDVVLTQDGYQLPYIAKVTIDTAGNVNAKHIDGYEEKDEAVSKVIEKEKAEFEQILKEEIGSSAFSLYAKDASGTWLVRSGETNLGDFATDAYKYAAGTEIAILNGGGLRTDISEGTITYGDLLDVTPYGNTISAKYVTGQELADALEYSVHSFPDMFGGFLQVSGVTFDVDANVESPVVTDDEGSYLYVGEGTRRVSNIKVNGEDLDYGRKYTVSSINYILDEGGNGYSMFKGEKIDFGKNITDVEALKEYLLHLGGVIPDEYSDPDGQGRINFSGNE